MLTASADTTTCLTHLLSWLSILHT